MTRYKIFVPSQSGSEKRANIECHGLGDFAVSYKPYGPQAIGGLFYSFTLNVINKTPYRHEQN